MKPKNPVGDFGDRHADRHDGGLRWRQQFPCGPGHIRQYGFGRRREHTGGKHTVKIMYFGDATTEDTNEVAAKLSELTKAKYNTTIDMVRVGFGSYKDQRIWR